MAIYDETLNNQNPKRRPLATVPSKVRIAPFQTQNPELEFHLSILDQKLASLQVRKGLFFTANHQ